MSSIRDILSGHLNELVGNNEELSTSRLEICKDCGIFKIHSEFGPMCNGSKYINENNEISDRPQPGYVKGCGCRLKAKTRVPSAKCIINKW